MPILTSITIGSTAEVLWHLYVGQVWINFNMNVAPSITLPQYFLQHLRHTSQGEKTRKDSLQRKSRGRSPTTHHVILIVSTPWSSPVSYYSCPLSPLSQVTPGIDSTILMQISRYHRFLSCPPQIHKQIDNGQNNPVSAKEITGVFTGES